MNSSTFANSIKEPECSNCTTANEISGSRSYLEFKPSNWRTKFCWFYSTYGECKFGRNCNFIHATFNRFRQNGAGKRNGSNRGQNVSRNNAKPKFDSAKLKTSSNLQSSQNATNCRIFQASALSDNDCALTNSDCTPENATASQSSDVCEKTSEGIKLDQSSKNQFDKQVKTEFSTSLQSAISTSKLSNTDDLVAKRKTEISLFWKRYPHLNHQQENEGDIFKFTFSSSDPDWVFSVKFIQMQVILNKSYPKEVCEIIVLDENEEMPPLLLRYLNNSIKQWLLERHKANEAVRNYELVLRPFFKWLDKNLEELFVQGLRKVKREIEAEKAGFEFVPHELLPGAVNKLSLESNGTEGAEENRSKFYDASVINIQDEDPNIKHNLEDVSLRDASVDPNPASDSEQNSNNIEKPTSVTKRGTEVKLIGLELMEGTASFECKKIFILLNCARCKTPVEISALPKQCHSVSCTKCHQTMQMTFQPSLLHQHSNVLGYLHLFDCQVVDLPLPQCIFFIDCLNCNKRNEIDGIHYGQMLTTWCLHCHQKLCLIAQTCKFQYLQPAVRTGKQLALSTEKKQVKVKDIVLELGKPLPKEGTCVHYRKSHRWLRFPCCGKLYPCDICHNEVEIDHEMKYASRMICGFCSKEQPYSSDKPCILCSSFTTRKSGKHWEGGKGCRDRIRMSRDDKQKFAGIHKTVSRKSSQLQKPKKKS